MSESKLSGGTMFLCKRNGTPTNTVKVQLEIRPETLAGFKQRAETLKEYTPKQIMENVLNNFIDGVAAK